MGREVGREVGHTTEPLKGLAGERRLSRTCGEGGNPVWPTVGANARRHCPIEDFTRCSVIAGNPVARVQRGLTR